MANKIERLVDENYIELLKHASGEIWTLFKAYVGIANNNDEEWGELIDYSNKILNKYIGTPAESYVRAYVEEVVMEEINRVSKGGTVKDEIGD